MFCESKVPCHVVHTVTGNYDRMLSNAICHFIVLVKLGNQHWPLRNTIDSILKHWAINQQLLIVYSNTGMFCITHQSYVSKYCTWWPHVVKSKPVSGKLTAVWEMSANWPKVTEVPGKNVFGERCLLLTLHFGLMKCLVVLYTCIYDAVKYGLGNCSYVRSGAE